MSKFILITGINGFVGINLYKYLNDDFQIFGLDLYHKDFIPHKMFYNWDDLNKVPATDTIIHLAGKAHDTKNTSSGQEYIEVNVNLTKQIFQHFLRSSASKFIFFSSVKAVADSVRGDQLIEEITPNPLTPYGKSKLEAEKYILKEWQQWKEERDRTTDRLNDRAKGTGPNEKKVYILRPCMIHGPGNKGNLNLLYKMQEKGLPWPLGAFENKRSFCSIDNILFVVQQLINEDLEPGIYQVADDEALSTNELIGLMALSQDKKARIWHLPVNSIKVIARAGDFFHLPLNSERLRKLTESYVVSNQKIKHALNIDRFPVTAIAGMKKTLESFRK